MKVFSSFISPDKIFEWSFLGFILAMIFGGITIYTEFFRADNPELFIEILNKTNVFDIKEDINELKVFYEEVDIKKLNQTLSIIILKIKNDGRSPILKGYYDDKYPLNITLKNGKILKAEQISATNSYLISSALPIIDTEQKLLLPKIIIEQNESYTIKILALHSTSSDIEISVVGKIAGIKNIRILQNDEVKEKKFFWEEIFHGDAWINLARFPIFFFGFISLFALMIIPSETASKYFIRRKRKKIITKYIDYNKDEISSYHKLLFKAYLEGGLSPIKKANKILLDPEKRKMFSRECCWPTIEILIDGIEYLSRDKSKKIVPKLDIEIIFERFINFVTIKES